MKARQYVRMVDNHCITGIVTHVYNDGRYDVQGPYKLHTGQSTQWEKVPA